MPRQSIGPILLSDAAEKGQGQLSCSHAPHAGSQLSHLSQVARGEVEVGHLSLIHATTWQMMRGWDQRSYSHILRVPHPSVPSPSGSALMCCPVKVQGLLFRVQHPARGRTSSPTLTISRPALPPATSDEGLGGGKHLSLISATTWHLRVEMNFWLSRPCCRLTHAPTNRVISAVLPAVVQGQPSL